MVLQIPGHQKDSKEITGQVPHDIRPKMTESYHTPEDTQQAQGDFSSAFQFKQRALDIKFKLIGEEHPSIADSYHTLGDTQQAQGNFSSALQSKQLDIMHKPFEKNI